MNRLASASLLLATLLVSTGCQDDATPLRDTASEQAYAVLSNLTLANVDSAFVKLNGTVRVIESTTTELDDAGEPVGISSVRASIFVDMAEEGMVSTASVEPLEQSGTLADSDSLVWTSITNPLPAILPDNLPYLSERTRDRYNYALRPDTLVNGRQLTVVEATLRPDHFENEPIRSATYFVDESQVAWGFRAHRVSQSTLLDESSRVEIWLQQEAGWPALPSCIRIENTISTAAGRSRVLIVEHRVVEVTDH